MRYRQSSGRDDDLVAHDMRVTHDCASHGSHRMFLRRKFARTDCGELAWEIS